MPSKATEKDEFSLQVMVPTQFHSDVKSYCAQKKITMRLLVIKALEKATGIKA